MPKNEKGIPIRLLARAADHASAADDDMGLTPLHRAVFEGSRADVTKLIRQGMAVDAVDVRGWTPLHDAAIQGRADIVALLLDAGAPINAQDTEDQYTPLHDAARMNFIDVAKLLLAAGADTSRRNRWNEMALDVAKKHDFTEMVHLLS